VGVGGGLAALKRASDQAYVEPRRMSLVQKRYSVVIRADETGHPTVVKASGIEERPQILFVAFWLKGERAELKTTHHNSPISFLYYYAIELYLKAFLRLHGHSAKELRGKKFGHNTCCLSERAVALGLRFDDEDLQVLSLMACTDAVIRSRYIQTGYFR
jgi:hypothetical protein